MWVLAVMTLSSLSLSIQDNEQVLVEDRKELLGTLPTKKVTCYCVVVLSIACLYVYVCLSL